VAIFAEGWEFWQEPGVADHRRRWPDHVLTLIAAVILTIPGSHGQRIFGLVMGLNRWCYRVLFAYVALITDEYPPLRLDTVGTASQAISPLHPAGPPLAVAAGRLGCGVLRSARLRSRAAKESGLR
jgi:hypothetical protein